MRIVKAFGWIAVGLLGFPACVTRHDIKGIQTDLYAIQQGLEKRIGSVTEETQNVQTSQADLLEQIRALNGNIVGLKTELSDYQERLSALSTRLDDLESSLVSRMDSQIELLSGSRFVEKPLPSTIFNLANTDFTRGRYAEAVEGFQSYLKQFPKGDKAAEARLKMGDSLAKMKNSSGALAAYEEVVATYPKDRAAASALLKKALLLDSLGQKAQAQAVYEQLIGGFPSSNEARSARDALQSQ